MKAHFAHEKLTVYQEAIGFVAWAGDPLETGAYRLDAGGLDPQYILGSYS